MNNVMTRLFWWWGWSPTNMERMLENMESNGWNLYQMDLMGVRFRFQKGEAQKVRYCVDYQQFPDDEYFSIYKDDGWRIKWTGGKGWNLWMKPYEGERPEIFTDTYSLIERNNRLIKLLLPIFVLLLVIFAILLAMNNDALKPLVFIYVALISLYTYFFYQVYTHNLKLKENIRE